jgi:flagellar basal-body rod modification protein FlgD
MGLSRHDRDRRRLDHRADRGKASWSFTSDKPAAATINISDSTGNLAYSGAFSLNAGQQNFAWDGRGNSGNQWPDGNYKMSITARIAAATRLRSRPRFSGKVDGVNLQASPPTLQIGGADFTIDKIKRVVRAGL